MFRDVKWGLLQCRQRLRSLDKLELQWLCKRKMSSLLQRTLYVNSLSLPLFLPNIFASYSCLKLYCKFCYSQHWAQNQVTRWELLFRINLLIMDIKIPPKHLQQALEKASTYRLLRSNLQVDNLHFLAIMRIVECIFLPMYSKLLRVMF